MFGQSPYMMPERKFGARPPFMPSVPESGNLRSMAARNMFSNAPGSSTRPTFSMPGGMPETPRTFGMPGIPQQQQRISPEEAEFLEYSRAYAEGWARAPDEARSWYTQERNPNTQRYEPVIRKPSIWAPPPWPQ